ncbi:thermonuclease family protein [Pantoea ananatis]|uniref:thermonuclease family protein n=1 Tax=Pantoea ananas TaxID=553 RepID=UPI001B30321C|nr:thermonuclease family protein [Pantoea ananatis]
MSVFCKYPLIAVLLLITFFSYAGEFSGRVIRVIDGDTIEVLQAYRTVRIRLQNIDAPEKKQAFGSWSSDRLKMLLAGRMVTVTYSECDRYGRILGRVSADGKDVSAYMVSAGAAWVYGRYNTDPTLSSLQHQAQAARRGLWADSSPVPPWAWRHQTR